MRPPPAAAASLPAPGHERQRRDQRRRGRTRSRRLPASRVTSSMPAPTRPGHRDREDPGGEDVPGHAPANGVRPRVGAGAHHRARDRVRRRDREAVVRGRPQDRGAVLVCAAKPCGGSIFAMRCPERLDDPPAADVRPGGHRERSREDHPERGSAEVRVEMARGDERERDDPHRLLGVVRAVREGDEAARDELKPRGRRVDLRRRRRAITQVMRDQERTRARSRRTARPARARAPSP